MVRAEVAVLVLDRARLLRRPQPYRQKSDREGDQAQCHHRRLQPGGRAEPAGRRIGQQPGWRCTGTAAAIVLAWPVLVAVAPAVLLANTAHLPGAG
jgi:hypothetical protein